MGPIRWIRTIRWSPRKYKTYKLRIDERIGFFQRIDPLETQHLILAIGSSQHVTPGAPAFVFGG